MSINSLSDLSHQRMLSILGYSSPGQTGSSTGAGNNLSTLGASANQASSFAQMLAELQHMEESNPAQYAKVSQQISTNLSTAASAAQAQGQSSLAKHLTTLSQDFSSAAQTGQLPNFGDLETAMHNAAHKAKTGAASLTNSQAHNPAMNIISQVLSLAGI